MKLFPLSLFVLVSITLSACNTAHFSAIHQSDSDLLADTSSNPADPSYQLPGLLPEWIKVKTPAITHNADTYVEIDPFKLNPEDYKSDDFDIIWDRIRAGYRLPQSQDKKVLSELRWFARHQEYLDRVTDRAEPFLHFIMQEIDKRDMPTELALLPIVESAFQPFAYSHGQAAGIWQFIPSTGKHYGLKQNWWYDGRRDVYASTLAALDYLDYLVKAFDGNWLHALAAYNSGIGTVSRAIKHNKRRNKPTDFWNLSLPKETQGYVPKLMALAALIADPDQYNVSLKCIENAPYFKVIPTDAQLDLAVAAELAGLPITELYRLNPGFNRWATDPKGPHRLLIPIENSAQFEEGLKNIPVDERITWKRYQVKPEQTLSQIALNHHVTVDQLKRINNIRSNNIRAGRYLIIPVASKKLSHYALSKTERTKKQLAIKRTGKGNKVFHIVKSGDSLWDISRLYKVGTDQLARWNGLSPKDILRAGQKLVVWTKSQLSSHTLNTSLVGEFIRSIHYRVRNGDSLYLIAKKFNVSVKDLHRWNPIKGEYLQPGQTLKLYIDITKQASSS